jgi:hypothetical protein
MSDTNQSKIPLWKDIILAFFVLCFSVLGCYGVYLMMRDGIPN